MVTRGQLTGRVALIPINWMFCSRLSNFVAMSSIKYPLPLSSSICNSSMTTIPRSLTVHSSIAVFTKALAFTYKLVKLTYFSRCSLSNLLYSANGDIHVSP